jgi:hypothetical protein
MSDYSDPHVLPERVAGRLVLVIVVELTLLLGGTYGAWRFATGQGLGVKARPSRYDVFDDPMPPPAPTKGEPAEVRPPLSVNFKTRASFDLRYLAEGDPATVTGRLTSGPSRTTIRLDGETRVLGIGPGRWRANAEQPGLNAIPDRRWIHGWQYPSKVRITQDVTLVASNDAGRPDGVVVRYLIENQDDEAHTVGLRFLLDTHVGQRDGVPFASSQAFGPISDSREFGKDMDDKVPCFFQMLERDDLANPGMVATLMVKSLDTLELAGREIAVEPADRVVVAGMPQDADWAIDPSDFSNKNSCVALFWEERKLQPGSIRVVGFTYGEGKIVADEGRKEPKLALSYAPRPRPGTEFDILVYVRDGARGESVRIELPNGMKLVRPDAAAIDFNRLAFPGLWPLCWQVKVDPQTVAGTYNVTVRCGAATATLPVDVWQPD